MNTWKLRTAMAAMAAAVALGGTWHASLLADEPAAVIEEIQAEVIVDRSLVQADVVANSAAKAANNAQESLMADVLVDLELRLGSPTALVIADND
ncbi:MAG: hypothetical protein AAF004_03310 [Pseudomonadota bacterium]